MPYSAPLPRFSTPSAPSRPFPEPAMPSREQARVTPFPPPGVPSRPVSSLLRRRRHTRWLLSVRVRGPRGGRKANTTTINPTLLGNATCGATDGWRCVSAKVLAARGGLGVGVDPRAGSPQARRTQGGDVQSSRRAPGRRIGGRAPALVCCEWVVVTGPAARRTAVPG